MKKDKSKMIECLKESESFILVTESCICATGSSADVTFLLANLFSKLDDSETVDEVVKKALAISKVMK